MYRIARLTIPIVLGFALFLFASRDEGRAGKAKGKTPTQAANEELLDEVSRALLYVTPPAPGYAWPPAFMVMDQDEINAFASARLEIDPKEVGEKRVKVRPIIVLFSGIMNRVIRTDKDPDPRSAAGPARLHRRPRAGPT